MIRRKTLRRPDVMTSQRRCARADQADRGLMVAFVAFWWGLFVAGYQLLIAVFRLLGWLAWLVAEGLDLANDWLARSTAARSNRVTHSGGQSLTTSHGRTFVFVVPVDQNGAGA